MKAFSPDQKKVLDGYWKDVLIASGEYWRRISVLEDQASLDTNIKDLEIFHCDGEAVGWGDSGRKYKLYHCEGKS